MKHLRMHLFALEKMIQLKELLLDLSAYVQSSSDHGYLNFTFNTPLQASSELSTYSFA
jgi:hypothetical protein